MPELPEVEHLRRHLKPSLVGSVVKRVELHRADIHRASKGAPSFPTGTISRLERLGKQLAIHCEGGGLVCVHLGMSGRLVLEEEPPLDTPITHTHCSWHLQMGSDHKSDSGGSHACWLHFVDPRRFGGLWTFASRSDLFRSRWSHLGPDALTLTPAVLARQFKTTRGPRQRGLKAALLDQAIVAGLGNIYVDEALFQSQLHPRQSAGSLLPREVDRLAGAIVEILKRAIDQGGSTIRTWLDSSGAKGDYVGSHQVYGRGGSLCTRCGQVLKCDQVSQRTTVWCTCCQRLRLRKG